MALDIRDEGVNRLRRSIGFSGRNYRVLFWPDPRMKFKSGDTVNVIMFRDRIILTTKDIDPNEYTMEKRTIFTNRRLIGINLNKNWVKISGSKEVMLSIDSDGDVTMKKVCTMDLNKLRDLRISGEKLFGGKRKRAKKVTHNN